MNPSTQQTATQLRAESRNAEQEALATQPLATEPVLPKALVQNALAAMNYVVKDMPSYLFGLERQEYIAKKLETVDERAIQVIRQFYEAIVLRMRKIDASDIDLGSFGARGHIWMRVHGTKAPQKDLPEIPTLLTDVMIQGLVTVKQRQVLLDKRSLDFSFQTQVDGIMNRYRGTAYFDLESLGMNMRAINAVVRPYDGYDFHSAVKHIVNLNQTKEGLILITGITGSGKSTTLDAIIDMNNDQSDSHIIVIASPVEYVHTPKRSIIRHREVGRDVLSFKEGTVQALRQDPDIVMIGEMRDPDTIMAAIEITDSGHKVFSTLHTSSAVESIDRIIGEVPPIEQERVRNRLADVLKLVVSQKLVPTVDDKRVLAKEVLIVTPSVRSAIKNKNTGEIYQMITEGSEQGMITMEQDLHKLVRTRKITPNEAMNYSNNKKRMKQLLAMK
jgi:twitching motility protein PilT